MHIQLTSDLHGRLPQIPPCDILVIAGDVCPDFHDMSRARLGAAAQQGRAADVGLALQAQWLGTEFRAWLNLVPAEHIIGIAGNHDFIFEHSRLVPRGLSWTYLQDETRSIDGVKFYGLPWVPNLQRWAFYGSDTFLTAAYDNVPDDTDVVISHGPPRGYLDAVGPQFMRPGMDTSNVGSLEALDMLERVQPQMYVCGHIHEGFGSKMRWHGEPSRRSGTVIYNVAHVDESYSPRVRKPLRVTLP